MPRILCFGDSVTYGAWDSQGGWVARVRKNIDKICIESELQSFILTYNLGISSDTTERLLARFDAEIAAHSKESGDNLIIISIGVNDSLRNTDGTHWVELSAFEKNIQLLISKARQSALGIVFLGNLPVDETKTQPYRTQPEISSYNADIALYDKATQRICQELGVDFISIFDQALTMKYQELVCPDGVHPNDRGHSLLGDKVWQYLRSNSWVVE